MRQCASDINFQICAFSFYKCLKKRWGLFLFRIQLHIDRSSHPVTLWTKTQVKTKTCKIWVKLKENCGPGFSGYQLMLCRCRLLTLLLSLYGRKWGCWENSWVFLKFWSNWGTLSETTIAPCLCNWMRHKSRSGLLIPDNVARVSKKKWKPSLFVYATVTRHLSSCIIGEK